MWLRSWEKHMQRTARHYLNIGLICIPPKGSFLDQKEEQCTAYEILQQDVADLLAHDGLAIIAGNVNATLAQLLVPANITSATG